MKSKKSTSPGEASEFSSQVPEFPKYVEVIHDQMSGTLFCTRFRGSLMLMVEKSSLSSTGQVQKAVKPVKTTEFEILSHCKIKISAEVVDPEK